MTTESPNPPTANTPPTSTVPHPPTTPPQAQAIPQPPPQTETQVPPEDEDSWPAWPEDPPSPPPAEAPQPYLHTPEAVQQARSLYTDDLIAACLDEPGPLLRGEEVEFENPFRTKGGPKKD